MILILSKDNNLIIIKKLSSLCSAGVSKICPIAATEFPSFGAAERLLHIEVRAVVRDRSPVTSTGRVVNGNLDVVFSPSLEFGLFPDKSFHLCTEIIAHSLRRSGLHKALLAGVQRVRLELGKCRVASGLLREEPCEDQIF